MNRHAHHHHHHHHGRDHDHDHHHGHDHHHDHAHDHGPHDHAPHGPGHNLPHSPRAAAQWQTPHKPAGTTGARVAEPDLDKVEKAFVEGFFAATDPTSFLRLARIPFEMRGDGASLKLLRVEVDALTDVGSLTPHLGGEGFRYDPLPASFVSQRRRLRFVYFDGANLRALTYGDIREAEGRS
jgi:hypothetical protein